MCGLVCFEHTMQPINNLRLLTNHFIIIIIINQADVMNVPSFFLKKENVIILLYQFIIIVMHQTIKF